jgi:hypothetical protein
MHPAKTAEVPALPLAAPLPIPSKRAVAATGVPYPNLQQQPPASPPRPENMIASPAAEEPPVNIGSAEHQEEAQTVIQGIRDEPASDTALQPPTADLEEQDDADATAEVDAEEDEGSCYWDAATMAPLNTASAVSTMSLLLLHPCTRG